MYSMTGYGKGEYREGGIELTAEIKTVNNRYLDVSCKCPRVFVPYDERIRRIIRSRITRGHADVFVNYSDKRERVRELYLDERTARAYASAAAALAEMFPQLPNDFAVTDLMKSPDVLRQEEACGADEELLAALESAVADAADRLNVMRLAEGKKLAEDMLARMDAIEGHVLAIRERAPLVARTYREKLEARMREILAETQVDEARILSEAAMYADKSNIDEEITRLLSHIGQFRKICGEDRVGRKLDFLVQEFNREANTICSKSNDLAVTSEALALKNEIEKVREQVQNVE